MKKLFNYILAISAVCAVSCEKEGLEKAISSESERIYKTITVTIPETKTEMDGLTMKWSADDKINVIAKTTGNQATFTLKSGDEGKTSAVFEGTIDAADAGETVFYAVYPDVNVTVTDGIMTFAGTSSGGHRAYFSSGTKAKAIVNGYDPAFAPMFAVGDASLDFAFKLGFSLIKVKVHTNNVRTIKIFTDKDSRLDGRPSYNVSTGETTGVDSAQKLIECQPAGDGVFSTGATDYYYIPVLAGYSSKIIKNTGVVVTYIDTDAQETSKTTQSLLNKYFEAGHIYNFGDPFAPSITAADVNIAKDATGGTITFTVNDPITGGVLTAATPTAGKTNTISSFALGAVGDGTVAFTCAANTESSAKKAYVTLTYTYNTSETVTKDVVITQAGLSTTYTWNFTTDNADFSVSSNGYYKYNAGSMTSAATHTETETLYACVASSKSVSTGAYSCTADSQSYKYATYGGGASYLLFNTAKSGTLYVKATVGKSVTQTGNCKLGIKVNGTASGTNVDLVCYDPSVAELNMQTYSWTITNTGTDPQEIQIIKPTGSNSPAIYEIKFVAN